MALTPAREAFPEQIQTSAGAGDGAGPGRNQGAGTLKPSAAPEIGFLNGEYNSCHISNTGISGLWPIRIHALYDGLLVQDELHHPHLLLVDFRIDEFFYPVFKNVVDGQHEGRSGQRPREGGITRGNGFGINPCAVPIGGAQHDYDIFFPLLIDDFLYRCLIFQIHGSGCSSDKALGEDQYGLRPRRADTGRYGRGWNAVPLPDADYLLSVEKILTHRLFLFKLSQLGFQKTGNRGLTDIFANKPSQFLPGFVEEK